jgi:CSLREA domain-containing protein
LDLRFLERLTIGSSPLNAPLGLEREVYLMLPAARSVLPPWSALLKSRLLTLALGAMPGRSTRRFGLFDSALTTASPRRLVRARFGVLVRALITGLALLALSGAAERAGAQTYTCSTATPSSNCAIAIAGSPTGSTTSPPPTGTSSSYLTVSGATGPVASVQVVLDGVTSSVANWAGYNENNENVYNSIFYVTFVLEDPAGNQLALLGSTGSGYDAMNGVTITIKDGATVAPPLNEPNYGGAWPSTGSATVAPSSYWELEDIVPLYDAAPGDLPQTDGSATLTSKFTGVTANGTWTLHVADSDQPLDYPLYVTDPVSISGWQLILTYSTLPSTTTTVSSSQNPSYTASPNNTTTLTATVDSGGEPIGGGTVAFTANGSSIACSGGNQTVSGGTATCTAAFTAEGNYSIGAAYSGSSTYAPSSGETLNQLVINHTTASGNTYCNPGNLPTTGYTATELVYPSYIQVPDTVTQTAASVSVHLNGLQSTNGALSGDVSSTSFLLVSPGKTNNLDFLSHVETGNPQPSVDVTIEDGNPLVPNGEGENGGICNGGSGPNCDLQNDTTYGATDDHLEGDSFITQAGSPAPPSPNYPLPYGGTNAETFEQAFSGATAAGNWLLYVENDGGIPLSLSGGWCIDLSLNTGAATTTAVASGKDPAFTGNPVSFTATVQSGGNPVATGSVTFLDNGNPPAGGNNVIALNNSGQAVFTTSQLTEGDHKITASYGGASGYDPSENYVWQRIDDTTAISSSSGVYSYCNTGAVAEGEGNQGAFTPNPSNIFVTSLPGTVKNVSLTLDNFYTFSDSIYETEALISGPAGALDFFSSTGASNTVVSSGNYTFVDGDATVPQAAFVPASYGPTSYANVNGNADSFFSSASPYYRAPGTFSYAGPRGGGTFESVFGGTDANGNGTWSLFFNQLLFSGPAGAQNGWCLNFTENPLEAAVTLPATDTFTQGQQGASFTVDVVNDGPGPTGDPTGTNPMTVTDNLNAAFTYSNSSGMGWSCSASGQTVTCKNDSAIAESGGYPELTIDVNVSGSASGTIDNSVTAAGAGVASTLSNTDSIAITASTTTSASNVTPIYSSINQPVTLNAAVTSGAGTVSSGTVTFSVFNGGTQIGSSTSAANVSDGNASASYTLPGGTSAGTYTIVANYSGAGGFGSSSDNTHTLTVEPAGTTTGSGNQTANFSSSTQSVSLSATVTSPGGTVDAGTVTFTLLSGVTPVGSATTSAAISSGSASVNYTLPAGTAAGPYTIQAVYNGSTDFQSSSNASHILTVVPSTVNVTIGTNPAGLSFSIGGTSYTTAQTPTLTVGTGYALLTTSPQAGATGVQYVFSQWIDGTTSLSDTLTPTASTTSDTAYFTTQYLLTVTAGTGGTLAGTTAPNAFYNAGTPQTIAATPNAGYYFENWTGSADVASTTSASTSVTMNAPESITANFAPIPGYVVTTLADDPPGNASNCPASPSVGSSCTLRDAILAADANNGGEGNITFASGPPGTIDLTSVTPTPLPSLSGQITITGPGANVVTVSGNNSGTVGSIFTVNSGATVGISGLTIANGVAGIQGGGGVLNSGTLAVTSSAFSNNSAGPQNGGGIFSTNGTLTVTSSAFSNNSSANQGGGIFSIGGTLTVSYSTFSGNTANSDGGGIVTYNPATVNDSTFSGNKTAARGGAIANDAPVTVTVANSIFSGNSANTGAGLLNLVAGLNASYNLFYNNLDNQSGGSGLEDDCNNCTPTNSVPSDPNPNLAALGNYGGPTQTLLPLPASPAICAASSALVPAGITTDQRGEPNFTTYNSTTCYDVGAVQTNYALNFTAQEPSNVAPGVDMTPAPIVTVTESGTALTAGSASLSVTDAASDLTTTPATAATSASDGEATFGTLAFTSPATDDTLTATLILNSSLPAINLTASSTSFNVTQITPTLSFVPSPGSQTYGTAITSGSLDATATASSTPVSGSFAYTTTIGGVPNQPVTAGSTILPASPSAYIITATFTPASPATYSSTSTTADYTVNKATAPVLLNNLSQTYTGSPLSATAATTPSGLTVLFTYTGISGTTYGPLSTPPTLAGSYTVSATVSDPNYQGSASGTLTIGKATASVLLNNLSQTYTGSPLSATATTTPSGLTVLLTYTGIGPTTYGPSLIPPTRAGSYTVSAAVINANYQGTASGTLTIGKATASVLLGSLSQTYTGSPLSATATTTPSGLTVLFTYTGIGPTTYGPSSTPPTAAGSYTVVGTISNANYQGTASGTLTIISAGAITSPTSGSTLTSASTTFAWSAGAGGVTGY